MTGMGVGGRVGFAALKHETRAKGKDAKPETTMYWVIGLLND